MSEVLHRRKTVLHTFKEIVYAWHTVIYSHKKSAYKDAFSVLNAKSNFVYYCPPPVVCVPIVLATAVPIPVPVGVCIALSYLNDIVIVTGSDVAYASVL